MTERDELSLAYLRNFVATLADAVPCAPEDTDKIFDTVSIAKSAVVEVGSLQARVHKLEALLDVVAKFLQDPNPYTQALLRKAFDDANDVPF